MGPPVRYIEKTHDYYRRLGYPLPYKYARFDTTPFAPLQKPPERCRVGLVATAGITLLDDDGRPSPMKVMGGEEANVVEIASDTPVERLCSIEEHYDRHATTVDDVNAFFPITHLQDLARDGTIGALVAHRGGGYPLLRISARFLRIDYRRIFIGYRTLPNGWSILCEDPQQVRVPEVSAVIEFERDATPAAVERRIVDVLAVERRR